MPDSQETIFPFIWGETTSVPFWVPAGISIEAGSTVEQVTSGQGHREPGSKSCWPCDFIPTLVGLKVHFMPLTWSLESIVYIACDVPVLECQCRSLHWSMKCHLFVPNTLIAPSHHPAAALSLSPLPIPHSPWATQALRLYAALMSHSQEPRIPLVLSPPAFKSSTVFPCRQVSAQMFYPLSHLPWLTHFSRIFRTFSLLSLLLNPIFFHGATWRVLAAHGWAPQGNGRHVRGETHFSLCPLPT